MTYYYRNTARWTLKKIQAHIKLEAIEIIQNRLLTHLLEFLPYRNIELRDEVISISIDSDSVADWFNSNRDFFKEESMTLYHVTDYGDVSVGDIVFLNYDYDKDPLDLFLTEDDFNDEEEYRHYLIMELMSI